MALASSAAAPHARPLAVLALIAFDRGSRVAVAQVGARSTVGATIQQLIEIRDSESDRFARLLELLGEFGDAGKVLVFVNSQEKASDLFQRLLNYGHPNQMLHGDMQQARGLARLPC